MIHVKVGDTMSRIIPPVGENEGVCQSGKVIEVTDTEIILAIQVDITMRFRRRDGYDTAGLGIFIVRPDFS